MSHAIFFNPPLESHWLGHQFEEIYKTKLYEPFLRGRSDLTIIDAGGNVGLTSYYFSQFAKDVYTLEPVQEYSDLIRQMLSYNEVKNVHLIQKALYLENGKFPFFHNSGNKTMSSLNQAISDGKLPPEEVETITLDKLFADNNIEHCDLFKLDIEGSEIEVLSSEGFRLVAPKIDLIIGERHSWSNRNPNQLNEALKNNGFVVETVPHDADLFVARRK
jgi:FkbM family methyltransferase